MAASRVAAAGHHSGAQAAPGSEPRSDPQTPGAGQLQAQDAAIHIEEFGAHGQGGEERPLQTLSQTTTPPRPPAMPQTWARPQQTPQTLARGLLRLLATSTGRNNGSIV